MLLESVLRVIIFFIIRSSFMKNGNNHPFYYFFSWFVCGPENQFPKPYANNNLRNWVIIGYKLNTLLFVQLWIPQILNVVIQLALTSIASVRVRFLLIENRYKRCIISNCQSFIETKRLYYCMWQFIYWWKFWVIARARCFIYSLPRID